MNIPKVKPVVFGFIAVVAITLGSAPSVCAQAVAYGQIQGVVKDQSDAVIPGVEVLVRNVSTGAARTVITDDVGRYRALNLQPGEHVVVVSQPGFATVERVGIVVGVGDTETIDVTLQVAAAGEVITVTEAAPVVETEETGFNDSISDQTIETLPINGRRWDDFALLTPTAQPDGDFGMVSYRGISGLYNSNMVDGADNNQAFFSSARGRDRVSYAISQAAIKEFEVGISSYSAEFGRAVGGTINAVTKSGGNQLHGQAFYFIRDDALNANDPFNRAEGFDKLPERRQQFGFTLGGPIRRDKLFFFLSYDQQLRNFPGVVIDEDGRRDSNGNLFVDPDFDLASICSFDQERCETAHDLLVSRMGTFSRKQFNEVALGKLDWNINDRHTFGAQYNWHQWRSPNGITTLLRQNDTKEALGFDGVRTDFLLTRYTTFLTPNTINEFRFQFGRDFEFQRGNTTGPEVEIQNFPDVDAGQRTFLPRPKFPEEFRYQFIDNYTWIRGNHLIKFGIDVNHVQDDYINLFQGNGEYRYRDFDDWARDVPLGGIPVFEDGDRTGRHYRDFTQGFDLLSQGITDVGFSTTDWNFFVQDTIKLTPNLTLNLGLRYEYTDLPQPDAAVYANPTPEWQSLPAAIQAATREINQDTNNWAPRLGLAWDVGGAHKLVLRTGYGVYYGRTSNSALVVPLFQTNAITGTSLRFFPNSNAAPVFPDTFCDPPLGFDSNSTCIPPPGTSGSTGLNFFSADYVRPLVHSWDVTTEIGLGENLNLTLSYLGSRGQRLPAFVDINLPQPTDTVSLVDESGTQLGLLPFYSGDRPLSEFSQIVIAESTVNSWYQAFVAKLSRRWTNGLSFSSHLTISKALDDGQGSSTFFELFSARLDPFNRALEYGRSDFDTRKKFVTYFTWDPPFERIGANGLRGALEGFIFSGVVNLRDGRAFDGDIGFMNVSSSIRNAWDAVDSFTGNGSGADNRVPFLARNFAETTGTATLDLRISREMRFTEANKFVVIWEAFNLFNRTNFTFFDDSAYDGDASCTIVDGACAAGSRTVTFEPRSNFLNPSSASNRFVRSREMQIAFKFMW